MSRWIASMLVVEMILALLVWACVGCDGEPGSAIGLKERTEERRREMSPAIDVENPAYRAFVSALEGCGYEASVIAALLGGVLEEFCADVAVVPRCVRMRCFDPESRTFEWGAIRYIVRVGGRTYARQDYPAHYHRFELDQGSGVNIFDTMNGVDGVLANGAAWCADSTMGTAVCFDGEDDVIHVWPDFVYGDSAAVRISAFFYLESFGIPDARIISKATGTADEDHWIMLSTFGDRAVRARIKTTEGTCVVIGDPGKTELRRWHYVVVEYNGEAVKLWLDGDLVGVETWGGAIVRDPGVAFAIGNQPTGGKGLDGKVRLVSFW